MVSRISLLKCYKTYRVDDAVTGGNESGLWSTVKKNLSPYGRVHRVETPLTEIGFPDVVYSLLGVAGILELKRIKAWPKRADTKFRIPHLTTEQVLFLEGWARPPSRGLGYVMLQVDSTYLLLGHELARRIYDGLVTRHDVETGAVVREDDTFPTSAVVKALTGW